MRRLLHIFTALGEPSRRGIDFDEHKSAGKAVQGDKMELWSPASRCAFRTSFQRSGRVTLVAFAAATSVPSFAQSSVTIGGIFDLAGRYVKNEGRDRRVSLTQDGLNTSELVFTGTEDLGDGLSASFNLRSAFSADTGSTSSNNQFFNRRATVSLVSSRYGELRLGRDYAPTFWNQTFFDVFGTNGVGSSRNALQFETGLGRAVRLDNSIGYFFPRNVLGGFHAQFMVAASEGAPASPTSVGNYGRYIGGRIGYLETNFGIAVAYGDQRLDQTSGYPSHKTFNVGGFYDFQIFKILGYYDRESESYTGVDKKEDRLSVSALVPFGQSEIHIGADQSKLSNKITGKDTTVNQIALGYVYNLSKRTAVYTTASRLSNKDLTTVAIPNGVLAPIPGGTSTAIEFGLRHFF